MLLLLFTLTEHTAISTIELLLTEHKPFAIAIAISAITVCAIHQIHLLFPAAIGAWAKVECGEYHVTAVS
jgi:hypothetical protein